MNIISKKGFKIPYSNLTFNSATISESTPNLFKIVSGDFKATITKKQLDVILEEIKKENMALKVEVPKIEPKEPIITMKRNK